jgi:hypothetical protein
MLLDRHFYICQDDNVNSNNPPAVVSETRFVSAQIVRIP